eukprot:COSAG01_NODE_105_length_26080_cov_7.640237_2_plen_166_part_00
MLWVRSWLAVWVQGRTQSVAPTFGSGGGGADPFAYQIPGRGPAPYLNCSGLPGEEGEGGDHHGDGDVDAVVAGGDVGGVGDGRADDGGRARSRLGKQPPHCLNTTWLLNLLEFADYSGAKLIFGLDINARDELSGRWDSAPARALIEFATGEKASRVVLSDSGPL